jgi:hypothetical protein
LPKEIHELTRTFRKPVEEGLSIRQHLGRDAWELRTLLRDVGYDPHFVNKQLQELIRLNKRIPGFPNE